MITLPIPIKFLLYFTSSFDKNKSGIQKLISEKQFTVFSMNSPCYRKRFHFQTESKIFVRNTSILNIPCKVKLKHPRIYKIRYSGLSIVMYISSPNQLHSAEN